MMTIIIIIMIPYKYFTLVIIGRIADALNIDIKDLFEIQKGKTVI